MNPRTLQTIAFALGCILAVQSATTVCAQNAATAVNSDPQQPAAPPPVATSTPGAQSIDNASSGGSQATSPAPQTPDLKESLRVQQTKDAAKTQNPDRDTLQQPQGAAAARLQPTTGTAASQPAGAAFAPARQKRSRSFLIRLGVLAGASIAVGTVVALSSASPSKPPGSH